MSTEHCNFATANCATHIKSCVVYILQICSRLTGWALWDKWR